MQNKNIKISTVTELKFSLWLIRKEKNKRAFQHYHIHTALCIRLFGKTIFNDSYSILCYSNYLFFIRFIIWQALNTEHRTPSIETVIFSISDSFAHSPVRHSVYTRTFEHVIRRVLFCDLPFSMRSHRSDVQLKIYCRTVWKFSFKQLQTF